MSPLADIAASVVVAIHIGYFLVFLLRETIPGWALHTMYWCLGGLLLAMLFVAPVHFRRQPPGEERLNPIGNRITRRRSV